MIQTMQGMRSPLRLLLLFLAGAYALFVMWSVLTTGGLTYQPAGGNYLNNRCDQVDDPANPLRSGSSCSRASTPGATPGNNMYDYDVVHWRYREYLGLSPIYTTHVYLPLDLAATLLGVALLVRYRGSRRLNRDGALRWLVGAAAAGYVLYGVSVMVLYRGINYPLGGAKPYESCALPDDNPLQSGASCRATTMQPQTHWYAAAPLWLQGMTDEMTTNDAHTYLPVDAIIAIALIFLATRPAWSKASTRTP